MITGAGNGIGRATALAFAKAGAAVAVLARSEKDLPGLRRELPDGSVLCGGDVSDEKVVRAFVETTFQNLAGVDVIVNNAAILTPKNALLNVSVEDWDRSMAVNLKGPFLTARCALPRMLARKSGLIINISSGAGRRPAPGWGPYAVSKGALECLTRQLAAEMDRSGVSALSVDPGGTRTRMRAAAYPEEDPAALPSPDEIAAFLVSIAATPPSEPGLNGAALSFREWRR